MIVLTGQIHVEKAEFKRFCERLFALTPLSRSHDGCIFYNMAIEDAEQGIILATEGWRDEAALHKHLSEPDFVQLLADFNGKVRADVKLYEVARELPFGV